MAITASSSARVLGHIPIMAMALLLLLNTVPLSQTFSTPPRRLHPSSSKHHSPHAIAASASGDADGNSESPQDRDLKRIAVASALAVLPFLGWNDHGPTTLPPAVDALQERNELLCNTGFFTNVGAWYCADIGNIGDEGKSKPISGEAQTSVDSLMSKFDLGGAVDDKPSGYGERTSQDGRGEIPDSKEVKEKD